MSIRLFLTLASSLVCASLVTAQGCCGGSTCLSANTTGTYAGKLGGSTNFALPVNTGSADRVICGVDLYCKLGNSNSAKMNFWIYSATSSGTPGSILRATTMSMTSTLQWHKVTILPLALTANTTFFIVFDNRVGLSLPIMSAGTNNIHYHGGPPNWRGPHSTVKWNYRVNCCGSANDPLIVDTGVPTIDARSSVDLSAAASNANALMAVGLGWTSIDLSIIGAAAFTLDANPLVIFGTTTSATGTATVKINVPNDPSLVNVLFQTQWAVEPKGANPANIRFTAGGGGKVGK